MRGCRSACDRLLQLSERTEKILRGCVGDDLARVYECFGDDNSLGRDDAECLMNSIEAELERAAESRESLNVSTSNTLPNDPDKLDQVPWLDLMHARAAFDDLIGLLEVIRGPVSPLQGFGGVQEFKVLDAVNRLHGSLAEAWSMYKPVIEIAGSKGEYLRFLGHYGKPCEVALKAVSDTWDHSLTFVNRESHPGCPIEDGKLTEAAEKHSQDHYSDDGWPIDKEDAAALFEWMNVMPKEFTDFDKLKRLVHDQLELISSLMPCDSPKQPATTTPLAEDMTDETTENNSKATGDDPPLAIHSADFRSVNWFGTSFGFTVNQAKCVQVLWEAWQGKTPELSDELVLAEAEVSSNRLRDVFKRKGGYHAAWGTMIQQAATKGTRRLVAPEICDSQQITHVAPK